MTVHSGPPLVAVILFAFAAVILVAALKGRTGSAEPAVVAKPFLTARESAMLAILEEVLPGCRIHGQVAMGALLRVEPVVGRKMSPAHRNRFSQKIVDFVAQDRQTGEVVALIEIDDRSHSAEADAKRDQMTAQAGYRTIRIAAVARPTITDVRASLGCLLPSIPAVKG